MVFQMSMSGTSLSALFEGCTCCTWAQVVAWNAGEALNATASAPCDVGCWNDSSIELLQAGYEVAGEDAALAIERTAGEPVTHALPESGKGQAARQSELS
jgi:hypothetical protein